MAEKLSPERAVRLLRAKAAELEDLSATLMVSMEDSVKRSLAYLSADIALVAGLLADHMERSPGPSGPELSDEEQISREREFLEGFNEGRP